MMFYYIIPCDTKKIINTKPITSRYHSSLHKYLLIGDNGFVFLGYGYELVKCDERQEKIESKPHYRIVQSNNKYELESMKAFVRGSKTYISNDDNTYRSASCDVFYDGLKGFSVLSKAKKHGMEFLIWDYALMLSYIQKIQDYQNKAAQSIGVNESQLLEEIYKFDIEIYFSTPILLSAYNGYNAWQKLSKVTKLSQMHDEMLRQIENLAKLVSDKKQNARTILLSAIGTLLTAISAISAWPVIKAFFG